MSAPFLKAADDMKNLKVTPPDAERNPVMALYKQATVGDCNTPRPAAADQQGKWDAWNKLKGMSKADAEAKYVEGAEQFKKKYGTK